MKVISSYGFKTLFIMCSLIIIAEFTYINLPYIKDVSLRKRQKHGLIINPSVIIVTSPLITSINYDSSMIVNTITSVVSEPNQKKSILKKVKPLIIRKDTVSTKNIDTVIDTLVKKSKKREFKIGIKF